MIFQIDVRIRRIGHIVEIEGLGRSVNFDPKNYTKTLNALLDRCIELQPDLASNSDEMDYLTQSIQIQLTEIYKLLSYKKTQSVLLQGLAFSVFPFLLEGRVVSVIVPRATM